VCRLLSELKDLQQDFHARSQSIMNKLEKVGWTNKKGPASKLLSKKSGLVLQSAASGRTSVPVVYQLPGNWKVPQNSRAFFLNWTNYSVTENLLVNITILLFFKNGLAAYWSATWIVVCQMAFLLETAQYLATLAAPNQNKPNYFSAQYWSYQAQNL